MKDRCAFEGCERDAYAKSLCTGHYQQQHKGKELTPLRERSKPGIGFASEKECPLCGVTKPREDYYIRNNGCTNYACKRCTSELNNARQKAQRAALRALRGRQAK